jgi:PAS domain S-box-containing protein
MYGYPSEEIIGKSIDLLVPEDRMNEIKAILARIIAGKTVERLETIRARKNGMTFPVSLTISAIRDADFAIIGASMIGRDMTEQKEASEASEASRTRRPSSSSAGKPSSAPHTTASSRTGTPRPRGSMATTKKSSASPTG